jgi:NifU-like protein
MSTASDGVLSAAHPCPAARPLCHCLRVYADEVRQAIDEGELTSVKQVTQACGAGGGCTACHRHIKRFLAEAAHARVDEAQPAFGFA